MHQELNTNRKITSRGLDHHTSGIHRHVLCQAVAWSRGASHHSAWRMSPRYGGWSGVQAVARGLIQEASCGSYYNPHPDENPHLPIPHPGPGINTFGPEVFNGNFTHSKLTRDAAWNEWELLRFTTLYERNLLRFVILRIIMNIQIFLVWET